MQNTKLNSFKNAKQDLQNAFSLKLFFSQCKYKTLKPKQRVGGKFKHPPAGNFASYFVFV